MAAARSQLGGFGKDAETATDYLDTMKRSALGLTGVFAGALSIGSVIGTADEWGQVTARLTHAAGSADELAEAQQRLMEISDRSFKPIEEQTELFIRSSSAMRELGYNTSETLDFIDSMSSSFSHNATSAQRAESAINAISKATVAGKVSGQNWQTIMNAVPSVAQDIAKHLGVTETAVKQLAAEGKLSFHEFSEAVIAAREENNRLADEVPNTVGDAITKLSNHWKAYIGEANAANGATATAAAGIGYLADNLDTLVVIGEALAVGAVSKYFMSMAASAKNAGKEFLTTRANMIALSQSQLAAAQVAQHKATMERRLAAAAAESAATASTQRLATLALIQARQKEAAAINAVTVAQTRLNSVSSIVSRSGSALLGVMGGLPGVIALGGAAMYGLYQQQENARQSAREYGETIGQVAEKIKTMKLPETWDSEGKSRQALNEQNRIVEEQSRLVKNLQNDVDVLNAALSDPVYQNMDRSEFIDGIQKATAKLAAEQARLNDLQGKSQEIQQVLSNLEHQRDSILRQQAAEDNKRYQSQLMMNGAFADFNAVLSAGNGLLIERQNIRAPMILPQNDLTDAQQKALDMAGRNRELAGLKGSDRARRQAEFSADDLGLTGPENAQARQRLIDDTVKATELQSELKQTVKKTADPYGDLLKNQQRQLALYGDTTEKARLLYDLTHGELQGLSEAQKAALTRNATELDTLAAKARYTSLVDELKTPEQKSLDVAKERLKILEDANVTAEEHGRILERISQDMMTDAPKFGGIDASIGGAAGELFKIAEAEQDLQAWHERQLEMLEEFYADKEGMEQEHADRVAEISEQLADRQQKIQFASTQAMLSIYSDFTSGSTELLSAMG
ncbi:MAG TPA: phage tail tape measure protein, partial [Buttiauxella sp.]